MERPLNRKPRLFAIGRFILVCVATFLLIYYQVNISLGFADRIEQDSRQSDDESMRAGIRKRLYDSIRMAQALIDKQKRIQDSLAHADSVNRGLLKGKRLARQVTKDDRIYQYAEVMPTFPGEEDAMKKFIRSNLNYPPEAKNNDIEGEVIVYFIVEPDGYLSGIQVKPGMGIGYGCDEEAMRIVRSMPRWNPGRDHGQYVRTEFNLSVTFSQKK